MDVFLYHCSPEFQDADEGLTRVRRRSTLPGMLISPRFLPRVFTGGLRAPAARSPRSLAAWQVLLTLFFALAGFSAPAAGAERKPPLKVLFLTGGGYHDYEKLAPFLTNELSRLANATFEIKFGIDALHDPKFADGYDAVFYDVCFDEASDDILDHDPLLGPRLSQITESA
jgi:hypothetical protein